MRGLTEQSPDRFPLFFPPSLPLQVRTQIYVLAEEVLVLQWAQHLCLLPPELLHLSFHHVHLRSKGLAGESPRDLGTGITLEALEQRVRQGEGVLPAKGNLIHPDCHQEPGTTGLGCSSPRNCWITRPRFGSHCPES